MRCALRSPHPLLSPPVSPHSAAPTRRSPHPQQPPPATLLPLQAVRNRDDYYMPWRVVHLVKVWAFGLVLLPVVPFVMIPFLVYHIISFFIDRANLLRLLEPVPPSSGLCMRFAVTSLLPCLVPVHFAVGVIGYVNKFVEHDDIVVDTGGTETEQFVSSALASGQVSFYICYGLLLCVGLWFEIYVVQRRVALRRGAMTPWQVFAAAWKGDAGFAVSSNAEPAVGAGEHGVGLGGLSAAQARLLYAPPFDPATRRDSGVDLCTGSRLHP